VQVIPLSITADNWIRRSLGILVTSSERNVNRDSAAVEFIRAVDAHNMRAENIYLWTRFTDQRAVIEYS